MHIVHTFGHLVGGTLLVAGTSIGVGMLALPVATASGGLIPSLFVYLLCWLFMLGTGLLILEACIWMPKGANLITLSSRLLGKWGKVSCQDLFYYAISHPVETVQQSTTKIITGANMDAMAETIDTMMITISTNTITIKINITSIKTNTTSTTKNVS